MNYANKLVYFSLLLVFAMTGLAIADQGMWLLDDIGKLDMDKMKEAGLVLAPDQIYSEKPDCLAKAVVKVGGGTGSFVSKNGLIVTNHHVAFSALQKQATISKDTIANGFWAKSLKEEIPAIGYYAYVLVDYQDVTQTILAGVNKGASDLERYKTIEKNTKELVDKEEQGQDVRCEVKAAFGGLKYFKHIYFLIEDVRIVYAPPNSIGTYGGDIDNWVWPRHTGDFAFLRAYVSPEGKPAEYSKDNVPYKPDVWFALSTDDVKQGDAALVMGYPYRTRRYLSSPEVSYFMNHHIPWRIETLTALENLMIKAGENDDNAKITVARKLAGTSNYLKKLTGVILGLEKAGLVAEKIKAEKEIYAKLNGREKKNFASTIKQLDTLFKEQLLFAEKQEIINWMLYNSEMLWFAVTINKWSEQKEMGDLAREMEYMDRNIPMLKERLKNKQKNLHLPTDKNILKIFFQKALALPQGQRLAALDKALKITPGEKVSQEKLDKFIADLYGGSKIHLLKNRIAFFDLDQKELLAKNDSFIGFAFELEKEIKELENREKAFDGATTRLRPKYLAGLLKGRDSVVYPDANYTMRFSFGQVMGLSPRDGITYNPMTFLRGVVEKHTGEFPFNAPAELLATYYRQDFGRYYDKTAGGMPVNFITTNDGTGGNSGSPVLNGKGRLMGLLFDTNFEAVASDYVYLPNLSRTIVVDIRYVLFVLDKVYNVENVLDELTVE